MRGGESSSAAIGLAVGSALMAGIQLPAFLRTVKSAGLSLHIDRALLLEVSAFVPIGLFFLFRQLQVYIERFLGSFLSAGSISHLNYSTKTAQVPVTFVLGVATVSFPVIAHYAASRDRAGMREWLERTLRLVDALILPAIVWLVAFAPQIIETLYRHGEFNRGDVTATAGIMRIYAVGLIGQAVVSVAVLAFFAHAFASVVPGLRRAHRSRRRRRRRRCVARAHGSQCAGVGERARDRGHGRDPPDRHRPDRRTARSPVAGAGRAGIDRSGERRGRSGMGNRNADSRERRRSGADVGGRPARGGALPGHRPRVSVREMEPVFELLRRRRESGRDDRPEGAANLGTGV